MEPATGINLSRTNPIPVESTVIVTTPEEAYHDVCRILLAVYTQVFC
jgi:hypothetical protein